MDDERTKDKTMKPSDGFALKVRLMSRAELEAQNVSVAKMLERCAELLPREVCAGLGTIIANERAILEWIRSEPGNAARYLADPVSFLAARGFAVPPALRDWFARNQPRESGLPSALPIVGKLRRIVVE